MEAQIVEAARKAAGDLRALAERIDQSASIASILGSTDLDPAAARAMAKALRLHADTVQQASGMAVNYAQRMMDAEAYMAQQAALLQRVEKLSLWGLLCFWWAGKQ